MMKKLLFLFLLLPAFQIMAQARRDLIVTINPVSGGSKACLLLCSMEEHSEERSASSVFTTRLPTMPLRFGKWEESIFTLPGSRSPMQSVHLKDGVTFSYPIAGISRKARIIPSPDVPGEYILSLYWYQGGMGPQGKMSSFRIWTVVHLKMGIPAKIGSFGVEK